MIHFFLKSEFKNQWKINSRMLAKKGWVQKAFIQNIVFLVFKCIKCYQYLFPFDLCTHEHIWCTFAIFRLHREPIQCSFDSSTGFGHFLNYPHFRKHEWILLKFINVLNVQFSSKKNYKKQAVKETCQSSEFVKKMFLYQELLYHRSCKPDFLCSWHVPLHFFLIVAPLFSSHFGYCGKAFNILFGGHNYLVRV